MGARGCRSVCVSVQGISASLDIRCFRIIGTRSVLGFRYPLPSVSPPSETSPVVGVSPMELRVASGRNSHNGRGHNPGQGRGYQGRSYQGRGRSLSTKRSSSWTPSNNSRNEAKNDPCRYHGSAHTWLKCYGNLDGPHYWPGFTPRPHGATCHGP
eukprot:scaffold251513_cov60-Attheya_sp.AAC.1